MRYDNRNIGFVCGAFDLLHPGHILLLQKIRKHCDYLKVGLQTNPNLDRPEKNAPVQTMYERWLQLRALPEVDEIIPYDTERDLLNLLATQDISIRFMGSDNPPTSYTGYGICESRDIKVFFVPRLHMFSSSDLRERVFRTEFPSPRETDHD